MTMPTASTTQARMAVFKLPSALDRGLMYLQEEEES
jgi:hypothetical protein